MSLILEEEQTYLQPFIIKATYHPMNPDADVTCQTDDADADQTDGSFLIVYITFDEISLQFQSMNISLLQMYRVHLPLPELYSVVLISSNVIRNIKNEVDKTFFRAK